MPLGSGGAAGCVKPPLENFWHSTLHVAPCAAEDAQMGSARSAMRGSTALPAASPSTNGPLPMGTFPPRYGGVWNVARLMWDWMISPSFWNVAPSSAEKAMP